MVMPAFSFLAAVHTILSTGFPVLRMNQKLWCFIRKKIHNETMLASRPEQQPRFGTGDFWVTWAQRGCGRFGFKKILLKSLTSNFWWINFWGKVFFSKKKWPTIFWEEIVGVGAEKNQGEIAPEDRSFGSCNISKPPPFFRGIFVVGFGEEWSVQLVFFNLFYSLDLPPTQDYSDYQDCYIFCRVCGCYWEGGWPKLFQHVWWNYPMLFFEQLKLQLGETWPTWTAGKIFEDDVGR